VASAKRIERMSHPCSAAITPLTGIGQASPVRPVPPRVLAKPAASALGTISHPTSSGLPRMPPRQYRARPTGNRQIRTRIGQLLGVSCCACCRRHHSRCHPLVRGQKSAISGWVSGKDQQLINPGKTFQRIIAKISCDGSRASREAAPNSPLFAISNPGRGVSLLSGAGLRSKELAIHWR
jgi:hypothetical protein